MASRLAVIYVLVTRSKRWPISNGIPARSPLNVERHGFDFTTASEIWIGPVIEKIDDRRDYGEIRIIATGVAETHLLLVVYTWRGENRRIISARKASSREKALYEAEIEQRARATPD
jgi:uncharacterized protein